MNQFLLRTIEQLREFLDATSQGRCSADGGSGDSQRYQHIHAVQTGFDYRQCSKADRAGARACLVPTTGYSRAQSYPTGLAMEEEAPDRGTAGQVQPIASGAVQAQVDRAPWNPPWGRL